MKKTKIISTCSMLSALCAVIMIVGGLLGIATYLAPMISGILLIIVGRNYGKKYHFICWAVVCAISFVLVADIEQTLLFAVLFGLYPVIYSYFYKLPPFFRVLSKLVYFNAVTVLVEALIMLVFFPETVSTLLVITLLLLGNFIFVMYDFMIAHSDILLEKYLGRLLKRIK